MVTPKNLRVRSDGEDTRRRVMNVLADMEVKATVDDVQLVMSDITRSGVQYALAILTRQKLVERTYSVRNTYRVALFGLTKLAHESEHVWRVK